MLTADPIQTPAYLILKLIDKQKHKTFCEDMQKKFEVDDFEICLVFCDKAIFHKDGKVNKQNIWICVYTTQLNTKGTSQKWRHSALSQRTVITLEHYKIIISQSVLLKICSIKLVFNIKSLKFNFSWPCYHSGMDFLNDAKFWETPCICLWNIR